jgi:hypothetical protein
MLSFTKLAVGFVDVAEGLFEHVPLSVVIVRGGLSGRGLEGSRANMGRSGRGRLIRLRVVPFAEANPTKGIAQR